jgi:hypothetical protein
MIVPNEPQPTPDWTLPPRCTCNCRCATVAHQIDPHLWTNDRRRACGCCVGSCTQCTHGPELPGMWHGDQA